MHGFSLLVLLDRGCKHEPDVCNGCHNISVIAFELENVAILKIKSLDYKCVIWNMSRSDAINMLNNSKLNNKGLL